MNKKAGELGAENSCFVTPDGYDAIGQYTTAYDIGRIALAAAKNKSITKITAKSSVNLTLASGQKLYLKNTNALLNKDSEWYNPNVIGLKTGTTSMAGHCLISAAKNKTGMVISVVMNSTVKGRWNDANKLLQYGLKNIK
jgi:D-alanyl-D-alanine carboxypeptidase (penicillin-binding protein 5/6)